MSEDRELARLIDMLERKLARRRQLNEHWSERNTVAPVYSISLTFSDAEGVLAYLRAKERA